MRLRVFVPLLIPLLCAQASLAAYIQSRACLDDDDRSDRPSSQAGLGPFTLRASMKTSTSPGQRDVSRLELAFFGEQAGAGVVCEADRLSNVTSSVRITSLGSSSTIPGLLESYECVHADGRPENARLDFAFDVAPARFLDTYWLTVELRDEDGSLSCLNAYLTPDVGAAVSQTATWAPAAVFATVLVSGLWKELRSLALSGVATGPGRSDGDPSRAHIVRIGDCISYLQFVFFTGSLTLSYPGFLRPVVSRLSWSTLMFPAGFVVHKPWYDGVRDGIYQVNGTFGGTEGMELMTQVVGGTVTVNTWLNAVTLAASTFFLILVLMILGRRVTRARHFFSEGEDSLAFGPSDGPTFQTAVLAALRLFCSYLLLPLVAWSTYVLTYANGIPIYYSAAAGLLVGCLVALVWFAMWRGSPRRMGYLLVDDVQGPNSAPHQLWIQDVYAMSVFVLLFLRGTAIGGLQMAGFMQLVVLLVTELIQITLFAFAYLQNPLASQAGSMPVVRTVTLLFEIGFVPGLASFSVQIMLGFAVLLVHAVVLVLFFFLPGILDLYALFARSSAESAQDARKSNAETDQPPIYYTLQQIMRRPDEESTPEPAEDGGTPSAHPGSPAVMPARGPTASMGSRTSMASHIESPRRNTSTDLFSRGSYSGPSTCSSHRDSSASWSKPNGGDVVYNFGCRDRDSFPPPQIHHGVDYSFREVDLYLQQPRTKAFGKDEGEKAKKLQDLVRRISGPFRRRT